jgi:hypothetical protein
MCLQCCFFFLFISPISSQITMRREEREKKERGFEDTTKL